MKRILLFVLLLLPLGAVALTLQASNEQLQYATVQNVSYLRQNDTLRILAIGNSFSEDAVENYLWELLNAAGIPAIVGNLYIGGCTLERHYGNVKADAPQYRYRKIVDGKTIERNGVRISEALAEETWTHISFQQASGLSGLYATYDPYLSELIKYVRTFAPSCVAPASGASASAPSASASLAGSTSSASVAPASAASVSAPSAGSASSASAPSAGSATLIFHQTWAYSADSSHPEFPVYGRSQNTMYHRIVNAVSVAMAEHPELTLLVPSGTAIQNARTSSLGDTFIRDGFHLNYTYGRYTAACTWFAALTGLRASNNSWKPQSIDSATAAICRLAADLATDKPLEVSTINSTLAPETAAPAPSNTSAPKNPQHTSAGTPQSPIYTEISPLAPETAAQYRQERCKLDIYYPTNKKAFKTIVWFHGGGLVEGEKHIPEQLTNKGIAVVAVNYRLSPKATCPAYIRDAAAAVAWTFEHIAEYGGDPSQIYVSGHSAGGYLTLMLAMDKAWLAAEGVDADSVAGYYPISGQTVTHYAIRAERGLSSTTPLVDCFAPIGNVRVLETKLVLYTGERSKELMARYEENLYLKAVLEGIGNPTIPLFEYPGTDHGSVLSPAFNHILQDIGC